MVGVHGRWVAPYVDHESLHPPSLTGIPITWWELSGSWTGYFYCADMFALYVKAEIHWASTVLAVRAQILWEQSVTPQIVAEGFHSPSLQSPNNYRTCYIWTRDYCLQGGQGQEEGEVKMKSSFLGVKIKEGAWNTDWSTHSRDSLTCKILLDIWWLINKGFWLSKGSGREAWRVWWQPPKTIVRQKSGQPKLPQATGKTPYRTLR